MLHQIDFSELNDFVFGISSSENFNTITKWMDRRFMGLPLFHKSVHLKVKRFEKVIESEPGELLLPKSVYKVTAPHLANDLNHLLNYIQREGGIKSFGLLHLSVKLMPHLLKHEILRYKTHGKSIPSLLTWLGSQIEVPVILAVASRRTDNNYESLAVGLRGLDSYASALTLCTSANKNGYVVQAGLHTCASLDHIDHSMAKLLNVIDCQLLPKEFFNRYLKNYLIPERQDIVKALCEYVFHGCQLPEKFTYPIRVRRLSRENLISC